MTDDETPTQDDTPTADETPATEVAAPEPPAAPPEPPAAPPEPAAAPPEPAAAAPENRDRSYVKIPTWLFVVGAALILAAGSFALGRATAPDDNARGVSIEVPDRLPEVVPPDELPQNTNSAFLGVATVEADDGAEIQQLAPGSPADDGGLEVGDVITAVDDDEVDGPEALLAAIGAHDPGDEVTVTYLRNDNERSVDVELADRTEPQAPSPN